MSAKRHALFVSVATSVALAGLFVAPGTSGAKKMAVPKTEAAASKAVTPKILDAVSAELERALAQMRIPGAPAPYFIGYKLTEVDVHDVVASLGSITSDKDRDVITLEAHVHVGSYDNDNSNFVASGREGLDGTATVPLALEASPKRARRSAWLATDRAYKEAIAQWQAKNEAIASGASSFKDIPNYSKSPAVVTEKPVSVPKITDNKKLTKRAETLSAGFRDHSHIRDSRVAFTSFIENRWYLNSEGTNATDTRRVEGIAIVATAQAKDGQEVSLSFTRYGRSNADLPSDAELKAQVSEMAAKLKKLSEAPLLRDNYTGPVLFEGTGAVGIARYTLAPHLTGTPPPVGISSTDALLAGKLIGREGARATSELLSVVDDPTAQKFGNQWVIGGYKFDDEGVAPKRIQVIKNGKLVELLTSRTPNKKNFKSNGHARLSLPGGVFRGSPTNTVITGKKGKSTKQLRKALLAEAKDQGLPYAIIIRQLDDVALSANAEISRIALVQILRSMNAQSPPAASVAVRIYPDGREEFVRGVQLEPVQMRAWRDVFAVGKTPTLKNFLNTTENVFSQRLVGVGPGWVPSAGIESSIATPDLLFRELDIKPSQFGMRPLPGISAP